MDNEEREKEINREIVLKAEDGVIEIWLSDALKEEIEQRKQMEIPQWVADMYK